MAEHGPEKGIKRWLYTTNHKDIGTMYLIFSLIMFFIGGAMALVIRSELMQPGLQFVHPEFFQPDDHDARPDHGLRCSHAGLRRAGELDDPD